MTLQLSVVRGKETEVLWRLTTDHGQLTTDKTERSNKTYEHSHR